MSWLASLTPRESRDSVGTSWSQRSGLASWEGLSARPSTTSTDVSARRPSVTTSSLAFAPALTPSGPAIFSTSQVTATDCHSRTWLNRFILFGSDAASAPALVDRGLWSASPGWSPTPCESSLSCVSPLA